MSKITADIKLGYSCNNDCIHCVISNQKKRTKVLRGDIDLKTDEYLREIDEVKKRGAHRIIITGGEPTIRKDFFEILEYVKKYDFQTFLQTNGRSFSSKEFAKRTAKNTDIFLIPLLGSTDKIHDKITRSDGSFKQTVEGLKNLVELNSLIGIKVVINKYNFDDLLNIIKFVKTLDIKYVTLTFPNIHGEAKNNFDEIVPSYLEIQKYVEECLDYCIENDFNLDLEAFLPCAFTKEYPIKYFLDFHTYSEGSILKQLDMDDFIKRNDAIGSVCKSKNKICCVCVYNSFCEGYWNQYVKLRGFSEFKPITKIPLEFRDIFRKKLAEWKSKE